MGVLARVFEAAGLVTTSIALVRLHVEKVKPPRSLFVPFPYGYALGKPNDPEYQHSVIAAALDLLQRDSGPVLADFEDEEEWPQLVQSTDVDQGLIELDPADEITALRPFYERWVEQRGGRTGVGLTGIPQRRFRGMIRVLQSYAATGQADTEDRPADIPFLLFLRHCSDDLKAFVLEARMAQRPQDSETDMHRWFWSETATAKLLADVVERMKAADDPAAAYYATGIAR